MTRNLQDEYPLILSQSGESDKDKKIRNKKRVYPSNAIEWIEWIGHSNPAFWYNQLIAATPFVFCSWDEIEQHNVLSHSPKALEEGIIERSLRSISRSTYPGHFSFLPNTLELEEVEEIMERVFRSIYHSISQGYLPDPVRDTCPLCISQTNSVHGSGFTNNVLLGFLATISKLPIILSEQETFMSGSFGKSTRTYPIELTIYNSTYPEQNLSLLENLHVEYTDDLEGIDGYIVANGITMRLVIKRNLAPEDRTRGIMHLLTLCNYGQEIGVYMWNVDDESIETY